jgi:hypothetical protein
MNVLIQQYAVMAEVMAHAGHLGPEAMNCAAPDTGNMGESTSSCVSANAHIINAGR